MGSYTREAPYAVSATHRVIASGMRRQCSRTDENAPGLSVVL